MPELYKRPDSEKFYARCFYAEGGRRICRRRSTGVIDDGTAKTRRAAEAVARDLEQSLALGAGRTARAVTLKQGLQRMILDMERAQRAQPTIDIVLQKSERLFEIFDPARPADSITDDDLKAYADAALGDGRHRGSIHRELRTLRQAIKAAGYPVPAMPQLGQVYEPRDRALSPTEQQSLLLATPTHRRDYLVVYLQAGLRQSELYKIGETDFEARTFFVAGTKTPKSKRWVPMSSDVYAVLWRRRKAAERFPLWRNVDRDLKRYSVRAGLGEVSCNDLRRSFASAMAPHVRELVLAKVMGTSPAMLHRVYAQLRLDDVAHAVTQLPALPCDHSESETTSSASTADDLAAGDLTE